MQVSHSKIDVFKQCPYKYKLRYIDGLKTYFNGDPSNALTLGTALHNGIEQDVETAIKEYYKNYPIITDEHINEAIKLEIAINKCNKVLDKGIYEEKILCGDFIGFIDLLVPIELPFEHEYEIYDMYDFKYAANPDSYSNSGQLHEYKYFFEKSNPKKRIRNMYFVFAPKVSIRQKKTETLEEFRLRLRKELKDKDVIIKPVSYDSSKVLQFLRDAKECKTATKFNKNPSRLCEWCEFKNYCESKGKDDLEIMNLPKNERRKVSNDTYKKIWLYGQPFSGKTYLANKFPNVLMLNTDGNIKYVDAPFIAIKDDVKVDGRITRRVLAWQIFKDTIEELEKKQNDFETIVVDLLEDTYEHCRLYCYDKLGIEHESDNSFKAWDYVKTEFLSTIKRLMNLGYNIILISHEDTSKDLTRKTGDKITAIKPNLQEKAALKIAGMVDIVGRVTNDEGHRAVSFKTNEVVFGGGRLTLDSNEVPCTYEAICEVYHSKPKKEIKKESGAEVDKQMVENATKEPEATETPETTTRRRRSREIVEEAKEEVAKEETKLDEVVLTTPAPEKEEAPVRRRRRVQ